MKKQQMIRWLAMVASLVILMSCHLPAPAESPLLGANAQQKTAFEAHALETVGMVLTLDNLAATPTLALLPSESPFPSPSNTAPSPSLTPTPVPPSPTSALANPTDKPPVQTSAATQTKAPQATSTATTTPTITQGAPSSNLCNRGTRLFKSQYWAGGPALDGDLLDWSDSGYYIRNVVHGYDKWAGDYDLSGTFRARWNEQYLFLGATIQDERYNQHETSWQLYLGDSLEIFIDADLCGDFDSVEMSSDDYQIGISPGYFDTNGSRDVYRWYPQPGGSMSNVNVGTTRRPDDTTHYEVSIPWSALGISSPQVGMRLGFVFSVSDNDDPLGAKVQETILSTVDNRSFNPKTWTMLVLEQ